MSDSTKAPALVKICTEMREALDELTDANKRLEAAKWVAEQAAQRVIDADTAAHDYIERTTGYRSMTFCEMLAKIEGAPAG